MNEADCYNRNSAKIKLLKGGIEKTNLSILDLTSVLSGFEIIKEGSKEYFGEVQKIRNDLQKQLDDDEFASDEEQVITKEDVLSAAEGKIVLVWGIRPEIAERLTSEYPDIVNCIIMEDGRQSGGIPNGALEKVDAAIIVTNFSSHGMYYKARDEIKASGVPYAHARKNVNSPDRFGRLMWKVLTGTDNRNLKE